MDYFFQAPTINYCEAALTELVARPWYALSNMAFFVVAVSILMHGGRSARIFGGLALLVGLLSAIYDITFTYLSQLFDLSGMLVLIGYVLYRNLTYITHRPRLVAYGLLGGFIIGLGLILLFKGYAGNVVFGVAVAMYVATELYLISTGQHMRWGLWLAALGVFIVGSLFWLADAAHTYCTDVGLFNGRAVFHYTNAAAIYLLFRFYQLQESS